MKNKDIQQIQKELKLIRLLIKEKADKIRKSKGLQKSA